MTTPVPLIAKNQPVAWWFAFKLNTEYWEGCGGGDALDPGKGLFEGHLQDYDAKEKEFGLQYVFASSKQPQLQKGTGCLGSSGHDPVSATFSQVYDGDAYYVLWNDQFYGEPIPNRSSPWGHSKGLLAWDESGSGLVMQVSTPSWPASGSRDQPRGPHDGNTLGYVKDDDVEVSQHFFCLQLTMSDVLAVLEALINAKVATETDSKPLVNTGGPKEITSLVETLGAAPDNPSCTVVPLSSGVKLISKPATIQVPPWQLVSAQLSGLPLRVASWWAYPKIPSTTGSEKLGCWPTGLGQPGAVEIATSGIWDGQKFSLLGGDGLDRNHAKFAVSKDPKRTITIFGDMNQQGALSPGSARANQTCSSSQNGRGGTFYALSDPKLWASVSALLVGDSAPTQASG